VYQNAKYSRPNIIICRDVNGASKSHYPWGIPLLGLEYRLKLIPMDIDLGEILSPLGMAGTGLRGLNPNPITHGAVLYPIYYNIQASSSRGIHLPEDACPPMACSPVGC
jgi:hypothetical protein